MRRAVLIAALTLLSPGPARAGGFEVPDQSAVAGATGGAGTGRRGDPASAWYGPAEAADGGGLRLGLGALLAIPSITATGLEEPRETATTEEALSPPPHLHLSFAWGSWAVGAYAGVSHGSTVIWPWEFWGRFESIRSEVLGIRAAPFFALRLGGAGGLVRGFPDIRLSAGAHVDTFRVESERALDFVDQEGRVHLLLWGAGAGGDASIYWQATPQLGVGFTYHSRTWMRLEGDADFTVPDPFVARAPDQRATTELVVPDRLSLGAAWQQAEFAVLLEVDLTLWSVRERLAVDFEDPDTTDTSTPARWHDAVQVRLGGEYSPLSFLHLRAGGFYDMEVGPEDTLGPSSPDMARLGVTAGLGVDIAAGFGADLYYAYVAFLERESTSEDAALARYSGELHLVGLTLRFTMGGSRARPAVGGGGDA